MPEPSFVHLRVSSSYSLLEGAITHKALVNACVAEGMPAVAVTDTANLFGVMQFCSAAMGAGVQPIIGAVMPVMAEVKKRPGRRPEPPAPVVLLVKDETGYGNLLKLMTHAYLEGDGRTDVAVTLDELTARNEGLILLSGGPDGPIGRAIRQGDSDSAEAILQAMHGAYGDRFYIELMRHDEEAEIATEPTFVEMAMARGIPLVATNDVHFIAEDMHEPHDAMICIAGSTQVIVEDRRRFSLDYRFKSAAEMAELFADLPEAIANTVQIARRCAYAAPARPPILPRFELAEGASEAEELKIQARKGLERRLQGYILKDGMDEAEKEAAAAPYRERLEYELDVIEGMQFPGYFLIVSDFIKWAKKQNIPVGPGRGSGAGSVVAWSLQITDLDPLRFGLLFERFLNPERVSMPDFDIDFCQDRRDEVIRYVQTRYGSDRVAHIITFGKLQARAALRDVGRVLGLPFGLVDRICKMVPNNPANPLTLDQAMDAEPRIGEAAREDPAVKRMIDVARKIEGMPRHASTHAAGVVIGDRPLDELVPLYRDPRSDMPVTQFNMKDVEKAGLVKFDFLGLTTLTMLRLGEDMINAAGVPLRLAALPLDDKPTYELLARAETTGVFQLESGGMRDALKKLKPDCFEDIIAMVSLYRPGPMDNIPRYINVKHGIEEPEYLHPLLEPILKETNGVIIYQEQVMEIARQLAGYSLGGADLLRRAMGKKIKEEMDKQRDIFVAGAGERGIEEGLANTIFDQVAKFASYGFNKSHAAAYALLAYHTAWMKANHPVEFFAAVMTMEMAAQDKLAAYRQEMRGAGLPFYPPDVNRSTAIFSVETNPDEPLNGGKGVRFALAAIKGVGRGAMEALVAERERGGPFRDLFDLVRRLGTKVVNKRILEGLTKAGALDGLHDNRQAIIRTLEVALRYANDCQAAMESNQNSLFGTGEAALPPPPPMAVCDDWPLMERLGYEFDTLGFYLSAHPLDGYRAVLDGYHIASAAQLPELVQAHPGRPITLAGVVLAKQERKTERTRFAFVQLSDPSAQYEVMIFRELLERSRDLLEPGNLLTVTVDARLEAGEVRLQGQHVELLDTRAKNIRGEIEIELETGEAALRLRELLRPEGEEEGGHGPELRFVVPLASGEQVVVELPRGYRLPHARLPDAQRMSGVRAIRDHTVANAVVVGWTN